MKREDTVVMARLLGDAARLSAALSQAITMLENYAAVDIDADDPYDRDDANFTMKQVKRFREVLENAK